MLRLNRRRRSCTLPVRDSRHWRRNLLRRRSGKLAALLCGFLLTGAAASAQISLYTVVDLARRNSSAVGQAQADVTRARASVSEARDVYIPSVVVGSSAGYSYGFPVGQPTIVNAQVQSLVVSFSQPDYIRAARAALNAATLRLQDALDQVELDTALDYAQLAALEQQLGALAEQRAYAERLQTIEQDRVSAGVESQLAATRAELTEAQTELRRLDLAGQAKVLRERLANLTGLFPASIQTDPKSIPRAAPGATAQGRRNLASVDASYSNAASKSYLAHGDQRQKYRPQVGFGFNYQLFDTSVNNYDYYYSNKLQANNFSVGVQASFPLYNATLSAKARESAADAVHAGMEAEQAREQADEQGVQLDASLPTLRAQARVAELQYALAQQQLQVVLLQTQNPPSTPGAAPLTPIDEMQARIEERSRFIELQDARFALLKAQLSSLRMTRQLSSWLASEAR